MITRVAFLCLLFSILYSATLPAQEPKSPPPRRISLDEAVQLAMQHNHLVRIAGYKVEEKEHTKDIARSAYFPILRNDSNVLQVTDTQLIAIPTGSLGVASGTAI